jgi:cell division protein FtsZ
LITTPGLVNLDFADVKSVMSAPIRVDGDRIGSGADRATEAAKSAISTLARVLDRRREGVLLDRRADRPVAARGQRGGRRDHPRRAPDANIIFGAVVDDMLGEEVRVTVVAAGLQGGAVGRQPVREPSVAAARGARAHGEDEPLPSLLHDDDADVSRPRGATRLGLVRR